MADTNVIRIKPLWYIHVFDTNTNLTTLVVGPKTFTRQEHETVVSGPTKMVMVPPRSYCVISNPVVRGGEGGEVQRDESGNYILRHGDEEIRFEQDPFPLYPGESAGSITPLKVVEANNALHLRATRKFTDADGTERAAGDEWLFRGPRTYIPRVEVQVKATIKATVVRQNQALKLRARRQMTDIEGVTRKAGEEWLYRAPGAYLPEVDEEVVERVKAVVLTDKTALHLRASQTFTDVFGTQRLAGEEWLVTINNASVHIPDIYEERVGVISLMTLTNRQYCVVLNPVDDNGRPRWGERQLRVGEVSFFLQPGEKLENNRVESVRVLGEDEALLLRARQAFVDPDTGENIVAGHRWMINGPRDYVPTTEVEIVEQRKMIPLDENEGIYVRDVTSGTISMVNGRSYMLGPNEELWSKPLSPLVEGLLRKGYVRDAPGQSSDQYGGERRSDRVITYRAPHNSAMQIYDYKKKHSRVVFGPELVLLGPDEQFTVLSLSGGCPKVSDQIQGLCLLLGPDFMTDMVTVETSDHARLQLRLAYNWHFEVDKENTEEAMKIFSVPDFVGDCCKAIASRIRGAVASTTFELFHKGAIDVIERSVFGVDDEGKVKNRLVFSANNLVVSNIDIQEVEPVDQKTRDSLQKSVQLAIEITTRSQEAAARRLAELKEQQARGQLQRQMIEAEASAEEARYELIQLRAQSLIVEHSGEAKAKAQAKAAAEDIKGKAAVTQAKLESETLRINASSQLEEVRLQNEAEIAHTQALADVEIDRSRRLAEIEAKKFTEIVEAIGPQTIKTIAQAGPEMQAKLLKGLGLKSFVITDGHNPINLLSTASGLISANTPSAGSSSATAASASPVADISGFGITGLDSEIEN